MSLSGKRAVILVADGVEDLECQVTAMRLVEEGVEVHLAGINMEPIRGKEGLEIRPTMTIDDLDVGEFDCVVLAGGWAPDKLRRYASVLRFVREMNDSRKTIGIICHGGSIAVSADIVRGRKATGSLGIKDDLVNAGATWLDEAAFREGNQVWGRVVADIPFFCRELVAALREATQ
ncbi:type 1 glutamine amidotransferase domain-containing protein (plasmid) [Agrobacterium deltaense]|uniref:type 1 glutamine amidotransferase domain-containing protein n=1 Tax=Agrobacterium deltaense TaxID=1183412 RepID=UPI003D9595C0